MTDWPKTTAKGAGECKKCGYAFEKGEVIFKINADTGKETWWCGNQICPGKKVESNPTPAATTSSLRLPFPICEKDGNKIKASMELLQFSNDVFTRALMQAEVYYPPNVKTSEGIPEIDVNKKDRMILAQVFYKGMMGLT